jgi:hypothetical protein
MRAGRVGSSSSGGFLHGEEARERAWAQVGFRIVTRKETEPWRQWGKVERGREAGDRFGEVTKYEKSLWVVMAPSRARPLAERRDPFRHVDLLGLARDDPRML